MAGCHLNPHPITESPLMNGQEQSQQHNKATISSNKTNIPTMPKRGKSPNCSSYFKENITWKHYLVHKKKQKTVEKLLKSELFQEVRLRTGMMKQIPSPFLKLYGGIKELTKQHIKLTHNYIHNKSAAPIDDAHRTLIWKDLTKSHRTHPSPLNNLIEKEALLRQNFTRTKTLSPFPIPPWSNELINHKITSKRRSNKAGGAVAILTNTQSVKTTYVGGDSIIKNFETELMALLLCQKLLTKHINRYGLPQAIAIFSDSQAALKSITLPKKKTPGQQLTTKIFNNFRFWTQHFSVRLYWCPGHTGIQHNEEVDRREKEAVTGGTTSHHSLHHISISKLKQIMN
ncbi:hypothetical protein O181_051327 [Austropuccinia psidii MF-1]|uniref:RNase H type-1 domain-containing protein n=1 Tax=Austropuccinia psidii MF-1 TaxID=1389203 RepID=A0A9Q3E0R4_9BASI|nr:hypothetical protein [Austropuccinia psidii MF-1]